VPPRKSPGAKTTPAAPGNEDRAPGSEGNAAGGATDRTEVKPKGRVGRPPIEAPNEEKRKSIADAALKLFSEFGFASVTNKELGEAAGIHPALIYYYFKDKDDLFQFVVRKSLTDALAAYDEIKRQHGAAGSIEAWLSSNILLSAELTRFLKVVLDYSQSGRRSPETDTAIAKFYDTEVGLLTLALHEEDKLPPRKAGDLAQLVSVFLDGLVVASVVRPEIDAKRLVNLLRSMLRRAA
jgi:AcrR family transcriptional regulator